MTMENNNTQKKSILANVKFKNKTAVLSACVAVVGLLLILLGEGFAKSNADLKTDLPNESEYNTEYVSSLQESLKSFISQIDGVGKIDVLVTLETGVRYIYATEQKTSDDNNYSQSDNMNRKTSSETTVVVIDGENGKAPVLLQRIEPVVMGVVVVCEGANSAEVRQAVTETVTTVCGIGSNRVTVTKKS
ncbi:MAG: hypothetical protein RSD35_01200 [Oscillospiraceae bacterium]